MRILKWNRLLPVILVGLCCGSALRASPFADDDGKDKAPAKPAAGAKIDAPGSGLAQTASANADSTSLEAASSEKNADSPAAPAAGRESSADETEQSPAASEASATNQEPKRRALPAPLDGIFPGSDYLGPSPLIGVPDTDPVYPLTKALWSVAPALKDARIKVYGWINPGISVSTSNRSNI